MGAPAPRRGRAGLTLAWLRPRSAGILGVLGVAFLLYACERLVEPTSLERTEARAASVSAVGQWADTFTTQIVGLHASLVPLPGSVGVLIWGHAGVPRLWDLSNPTPTFTVIGEPVELFCAGHTFLPDGSLLVAGGHDEARGDFHGIPNAYRFKDGAWITENSMSFARWYPTATSLENGDVIVYAGSDNDGVHVKTPERYSYATHTWTSLTGANRKYAYYPRSFLDPKDGRLFYAGEQERSRWLNPSLNGGLGKWIAGPFRTTANRNYGSAVMYEQGKILYLGGGGQAKAGPPPTNTAETIDLNQAVPLWTPTGSMAYGRRQINLTILADGKVLLTGGTSSTGFSNKTLARREAELWDPATGTWTLMAAESVMRLYHGTSLLLPSGRVLSMGGGDGKNVKSQTNGQIYSPPYLFNADGSPATRPQITGVSTAALFYGQSFSIETPDAASITRVHLIRFSAVTHGFNQSQMLYRADFVPGQGVLNVTGPASGRKAPPGPYLVFIVNSSGVPSEAKIVNISSGP